MLRFRSSILVAASLIALAGCAKSAPPAPVVDVAADEAAVRAINPAWFAAYNAGEMDKVAALYADDAVLSIPGAPAARGGAAIREALAKDQAASAAAGVTLNAGSSRADVGVSGDLGWEWNTFSVTDKSGATVDTGKYVTVYARRDGKWVIIRDIWNSDAPPPAAPAPAAAAATPAT
jgi:uncharacterized protein (TIGR02246 family)